MRRRTRPLSGTSTYSFLHPNYEKKWKFQPDRCTKITLVVIVAQSSYLPRGQQVSPTDGEPILEEITETQGRKAFTVVDKQRERKVPIDFNAV